VCGIAGIVHRDPDAPVSPALLERMACALAHRGPDDQGLFINGGVGLAHRRLSVIDLAGGHEPIFNEDRSAAIVFNGEAYNFLDLRPGLEAAGHRFTTRTDAEVVLHLWEEEGEAFVRRLRGMFAFAIWDARRRTLLLARDRLGKKPLYYALEPDRLLFASELKAILQDPGVSRDIDPQAVDLFFTYLYVPSPWSILKAVRKLPPASLLLWRDGRARVTTYWEPPFGEAAGSQPSAVSGQQPSESDPDARRLSPDVRAIAAALRERLAESVRLRLVSDVPLGAFLSGGLDSSLVVALMSQASNRPVITNTIGFTNREYDERSFARLVAERYRTDHHEFVVDPRAVEVVQDLAWFYDEPFGDSSAVPTYYAAKMARETVTVALSGDGGDENFAGYEHRYWLHRLECRWRRRLPRMVRRALFGPASFLWPKGDWLPRPLRWKYVLQNLSLTDERAFFNDMSTFRAARKARLYVPEFARRLDGFDAFGYLGDLFAAADRQGVIDPLARAQYVDLRSYLVEDGLTKVDRAASAHALEVRCPLLDHELIEFAGAIARDLMLRGRTTKWILKEAVADLLPPDILARGKWGFRVPVEQWLRTDLREMGEAILFDRSGGLDQFVRRAAVEALWRQHQRGLHDHGRALWAMLVFGLWHRQFATGIPERRAHGG
jgi:asparagine synthase (glutamine-hydrolysing)